MQAAREILQKEDDLNEIVQLVGKVRRAEALHCIKCVWGQAGATLIEIVQLAGKVRAGWRADLRES